MKNYAEKILLDNVSNDPILPILEIIQKKCDYGDKINQLTKGERVIYIIGDVELEVNNGGFDQYFFNSGRNVKEAVVALKEIGAEYTSSLLEEALLICKNAPTNDGRTER